MSFWRSLVPVLRASVQPSLREVSVSGSWTSMSWHSSFTLTTLSLSPGCCNRMLSGTGRDDDSHNSDEPKFFIDEETMKIIRWRKHTFFTQILLSTKDYRNCKHTPPPPLSAFSPISPTVSPSFSHNPPSNTIVGICFHSPGKDYINVPPPPDTMVLWYLFPQSGKRGCWSTRHSCVPGESPCPHNWHPLNPHPLSWQGRLSTCRENETQESVAPEAAHSAH